MRNLYGGKGKNNWSLFLLCFGVSDWRLYRALSGKSTLYAVDWLWTGIRPQNPIILDLSVIIIQFSIKMEITIASILGIIAAILIYKEFSTIISNKSYRWC